MLTKEGVAALLQVKAQKLAEPESLDMGCWIQTETDTPCGTVSCIAGQLIINKFIEENGTDSDLRNLETKGYPSQVAYKILGFRKDEWDIPFKLFHRNQWPADFYRAYANAAESSKKRAEILGQVIDYFIAQHYKPKEVTEDA